MTTTDPLTGGVGEYCGENNAQLSDNSTYDVRCRIPSLPVSTSSSHTWQLRVTLNSQAYPNTHGQFSPAPLTEVLGLSYTSKACEAGMYAANYGSACTDCAIGTFDSRTDLASMIKYSEQKECSACEPGRYQNAKGQSLCFYCPLSIDTVSFPFATTVDIDGLETAVKRHGMLM